MTKYPLLTLCFLLTALPAFPAVSMEEVMFRSGKIYTFLAVALIVLAGMFIYLFRLDRRLTGIEKNINRKDRKR